MEAHAAGSDSSSNVKHGKHVQPHNKQRRSRADDKPFEPTRNHSRLQKPFRSGQGTYAAFWDSLSKILLSRRALREFDRRTAQPAPPTHLDRPALPPCPSLDHFVFLRQPHLRREDSIQLKRLARHGGPDLCDLRGYPSSTHAMNSNWPTSSLNHSTTNTTRKKKISPHEPNFQQHLIDHGIYPANRDQKPNNWEEITHRLDQRRPSLLSSRFSEEAFDAFTQAAEGASTESQLMRTAFPMISGNAKIPTQGDMVFNNLGKLTDGSLTKPKPDFWDGSQPRELDIRLRDELGSYISPLTVLDAPALPNLFVEEKGPDGSVAVAKRQACYDGTLGARGVHKLRSFGTDAATVYDNKSYTISSTYHDGHLRLYTHHPTQPTAPGREPEYHMTPLGSFSMTHSIETFREGASAFRNARDWAKEKRDELIRDANSRLMATLDVISKLLANFPPDSLMLGMLRAPISCAFSQTIEGTISLCPIAGEVCRKETKEYSAHPATTSRKGLIKDLI
ncbi:hypothetical protein FGG08_004990 [Glutinoglossum americanum]|uniref:DUF7924 domain-containing protein n=1 Tax=Glutinoglossum americanum TaxID=1670608 RepID=A0A9P8L280_9PEZI|nr:hypothetical protein FGG08_004990 [Glutinoglossum americanum]